MIYCDYLSIAALYYEPCKIARSPPRRTHLSGTSICNIDVHGRLQMHLEHPSVTWISTSEINRGCRYPRLTSTQMDISIPNGYPYLRWIPTSQRDIRIPEPYPIWISTSQMDIPEGYPRTRWIYQSSFHIQDGYPSWTPMSQTGIYLGCDIPH